MKQITLIFFVLLPVLFYLCEGSLAEDMRLFLAAVHDGNIGKITELLNENRLLTYAYDEADGRSALIIAIDKKSIDLVKLLIDNYKADVNHPSRDGRYPLVAAIEQGSLELAQLLVPRNFVNSTANLPRAALQLAMKNRKFDIVKFLVSKGADPDQIDENGKSCRDEFYSVRFNIQELEPKTTISREMSQKYTDQVNFLSYVFSKRFVLAAEFLPAVDINTRYGTEGYTALIMAVFENNYDSVAFLIKHGANVNLADRHGRRPLHFAANHEYFELIDRLLYLGADVNAQDCFGWTALVAAKKDRMVVHILLASGADPDIPDIAGKTFRDGSLSPETRKVLQEWDNVRSIKNV